MSSTHFRFAFYVETSHVFRRAMVSKWNVTLGWIGLIGWCLNPVLRNLSWLFYWDLSPFPGWQSNLLLGLLDRLMVTPIICWRFEPPSYRHSPYMAHHSLISLLQTLQFWEHFFNNIAPTKYQINTKLSSWELFIYV